MGVFSVVIIVVIIMVITRITVFVCFLTTTSSLLYIQPYKLRILFYREETVIAMLKNIQRFYKSRTLDHYLDSCTPRLKELALLDNLQDEVEHKINFVEN